MSESNGKIPIALRLVPGGVEQTPTAAVIEKLRALSFDADGATIAEAVCGFAEAAQDVSDSTARMALRHDAIAALTTAKIASPARWIDGALSAPKSADENESDAQGRALKLREFEPWLEPVDGAAMLDEIVATVKCCPTARPRRWHCGLCSRRQSTPSM